MATVVDDTIAAALEQVQRYAEILRPEDVDEPILAPTVAHALGKGFVPVRKPKKLPAAVEAVEYALEYGTDKLEIVAGKTWKFEEVREALISISKGESRGKQMILVQKDE